MVHVFLAVAAVILLGIFLVNARPSSAQSGAVATPLPTMMSQTAMPTIEVETLRDQLKSSQPPLLVDVRETAEREISVLPGSRHIPLGTLDQRYSELPKDRPIVVYCHSGNRSSRAVRFLMEKGYTNVKNLTGGITAWAKKIDPSMRTY